MDLPPPPERPDLPEGELHVWRAEPGKEESQRALRRLLGLYLGEEPDGIELARGEHGKPRLAVAPERLAFNLSHSGELTLIAVCRGREVGVDIEAEKPRRNLLALAERALGPEGAARVRAAPDAEQTALFHELWVRHEARLKCLGVGLSGAETAAAAVTVETLEVGAGYAAAVAVAGGPVGVRLWTLDQPLPKAG